MPKSSTKIEPWVKQLRERLRAKCGKGWVVRGLGVEKRVQLTVRFGDTNLTADQQQRAATMLGPKDPADPEFLAFSSARADDIVRIASEIKRLITEQGLSLSDAAEMMGKRSAITTPDQGGIDWLVLEERFRRSKLTSGQLSSERSWRRNYQTPIKRAVEGITGRNGITNGRGVMQHLLDEYGGEPGSTGRRLRMQYTAQFLRFAVEEMGAPARWLPPQDLSPFVGSNQKGKTQTTYCTDDQISRLLHHLESRNRKWFNAVAIVSCFGLRGIELGQCVTKAKGQMLHVSYQKRTARKASGTPERDVGGLDPLGWEGLSGRMLSLLAEYGRECLPDCCQVSDGNKLSERAGDGLNTYLKRLPLWCELVAEVKAAPTTGNTGNELVPYSLRHAYAARADELGLSDREASLWMGHSLQTHHQHYSGTNEEMNQRGLKQVAAAQARRRLEALV